MYVGRDFSPAEQAESDGFGLDFVNDMLQDETVQTAVWDIAVLVGTDPNPASHLQGPARVVTPDGSTSQTATIQSIGGLLPNVTYKVRATVTTSEGNVKSLWSHIRGEPWL